MSAIRRGLSLIEVLVVLTIVGLLLALLMPAVQKSRESARRATCQNNLRQQALAIQNFESAYGTLPALYNGDFQPLPRSVMYEFHHHSWRTAILPQLELGSLYERIDRSSPATIPANQVHVNVPVPSFLCPSTSSPSEIVPEVFLFNGGGLATEVVGTAARSDYEAVGGFQQIGALPSHAATGPLTGMRFGVWGEPRYDHSNNTFKVLSYRVARFRDVTDGLSNTLLIGELAGRPDRYEKGKLIDAYPPDDPGTGMDTHAATWEISTHFVWLVGYAEINTANHRGFYSFHDAGANAAFADGSVRFLSETTSMETLSAMCTRSSGEVVTTR